MNGVIINFYDEIKVQSLGFNMHPSESKGDNQGVSSITIGNQKISFENSSTVYKIYMNTTEYDFEDALNLKDSVYYNGGWSSIFERKGD